MKGIQDRTVYAKESKTSHLLGLYYFVLWKDYFKNKNTGEPPLAVQHLQTKLIANYYRNNAAKLTAISPPVNTTPPMARPIINPLKPIEATKQKRDQLAKTNANKKAKITWTSAFLFRFLT